MSYENQYCQLEDNYSQLKELFDEYQIKSQDEKGRWVKKNKELEEELYNLKRSSKTLKQQESGLQS